MKKSSFVIWATKPVQNACVLHSMSGFEETWELYKGIELEKRFPQDVTFPMHPDFPLDTLLTDTLINSDSLIIASKALVEFLRGRHLTQVEYLPVTIKNHKGKVASLDYRIIQPVDPPDCLDLAKCEPRWSRIDKQIINNVKRLVLDESKVDPTRQLFRPKSFHSVTLVRRELAAAITSAGFTGVAWKELEDYH